MQHSTVRNERLQRIVENIRQLPSLPAVVGELMHVVSSPDTAADDAARLIEKDPALTGAILRLANSAFYGMPRSISSVSSAVVILGFNTIRSVALSASVMKAFSRSSSHPLFDRQRFWSHSILCGMGAKRVARELFPRVAIDPESAFCAGILHDIGKLIFAQFVAEEYAVVCDRARAGSISILAAEEEVMGTNHADVCTVLADKWALPLDLETALVFHHDPGRNAGQELAAAVHLGDQLSHSAGAGLWDGEIAPSEQAFAFDLLGMEPSRAEFLLGELREDMEKSCEFLSIISHV